MNRLRAIFLLVLLLSFSAKLSYSQSYTPISGVINDYTPVIAIMSEVADQYDSVKVVSVDAFSVGDTVMLYSVKGAVIGTAPDNIPPGDPLYHAGVDALADRNAGKYAFMIIREIIAPDSIVVFNVSLYPEFKSMAEGEMAQLIRVPSFRHARVTSSGLTCADWNPLAGTGGVLAMFVQGELDLEGDIDVSKKGFQGAPGSTDLLYPYGCSSVDTTLFNDNFYNYNNIRAGLKGEGTTDTIFHGWIGSRGRASSINGGGGGNGLHAGGGGGANYNPGVRGGAESTSCSGTGVSVSGGAGGFSLRTVGYYTNILPYANRIFFGGGGGSGTRTSAATSSDGRDGGGIVVIVADTIVGNSHWILANGEDVPPTPVDGAAGGGGGGGCIILEVAGYQNTLRLLARGGNGGNTTGVDTTGMGGAGGGGVYWLSGDMHTGLEPQFDKGVNGLHTYNGNDYAPLGAPSAPGQVDDLIAPLRGFLFNAVPTEFTYCSDVNPDPIIAADPKGGGGAGSYTYQWQDSIKSRGTWENITLNGEAKDYDPGMLTDTIYYRRIVNSLALSDTSYQIAVYIHPAITGNTVSAEDTVCYGNAPRLFGPSASIGGGPTGGTFTYQWQHFPDGAGGFTDIPDDSQASTYQSPDLTTTTQFRRMAYAGVCVSASNEEDVTVLPTITGNDITPGGKTYPHPYDTICINTVPDQISGPEPSNGDGDYDYQWLTSTDPLQMGTVISGETGLSYQSPALDRTTYIRRIAFSGNDNACIDTSEYVEILNVPDIYDNSILADQTVCQEDSPEDLSGPAPGGGQGGEEFTYTWISSTDLSNWDYATGGGSNDEIDFDPGVMNGDTTWYRRVVESGGPDLVCKDTSDFIVINVLPSIDNNTLTAYDDPLCQLEMPEEISGSLPGGGATVEDNDPTRTYSWEVAEGDTQPGSWTHPSSGAEARHYTDPDQLATDVDRWYRRIVTSGPGGQCVSTSDTVHLVVHTEITRNEIDGTQAICYDDTRALRHVALAGGEDGITPVYTWRRWLEGETAADADTVEISDSPTYDGGTYNDPANLIYHFDRFVRIGACQIPSNQMLVTVMQLPGGELTDADFIACEKDTVLQVNLNMGNLSAGHFVTPWYVYLEDGVQTGIGPGSLDQDMDTVGIVMDTRGADHVTLNYEIESIMYYPEDGYACISPSDELPLNPVVVSLTRRPVPVIMVDGAAKDSFKVCNSTATLQLDADNGTLSSWSEPDGSVFFSPGIAPGEYRVSIPDEHDEYGEFRIFVKSEAGDCAGLDSIDLHFFEQPAPAYAGEDTMLFLINSVQLNADPPTAGTGTWELVSGSGIIDDEHAHNTYAYELGMGEENEFRWTVINGEDEGTCITSNDVTIVLRNEVKRYNGFSPNKDMSNEYYIMQGLPYADEFTVRFFNSLGNTVRTVTQEDVDLMEIDPGLITNGLRDDEMVIWDGLSDNGNPVPSGTYYFVVTYIMHQYDYLTGEITRTDSYDFKDYVVVVRE